MKLMLNLWGNEYFTFKTLIMTKNNIRNNFLLDITTILTLVGINLYSLGWIYWTHYYRILNIDKSFIDIPFERIIVTSWLYDFIVIFGFIPIIFYLLKLKSDKKFKIVTAIWYLTTSMFILTSVLFFENKLIYVSIVYIILQFLLYLIVIISNKLKFDIEIIPKRWFIYFLIMVVYITSVIYYFVRAQKDAYKFINNYTENIELKINEGSIITGNFVSNMKNKYFILKKNNNKKELLIFNEDDVYQVKFK